MTRRTQRLLWTLGLGAAALVGLATAGLFIVLSDPALTTRLAQQALQRFESALPAKLSFERLEVSPFERRVVLEGLAVAAPDAPDAPIATVRRVSARFAPGAILQGQLGLSEVVVDGPTLDVAHEGGDRYNVQRLLPPEKGPKKARTGGSPLQLDRLVIHDGHVRYHDAPRRLSADVPKIEADLALDLDRPSGSGRLGFARGSVRQAGRQVPLDELASRFRFAPEGTRIDALNLRSGATRFALAGALQRQGQGPATLQLEGQLKGELAPWAPWAGEPLAGALASDFSVRGTTENPRVAGTLTLRDGAFRTWKLPSASTRWAADRDALTVSGLDAQLWGGRLRADGRVPFAQTGALQLTARAEGLDVAKALAQAPARIERPVTGRLDARLNAQGTGHDPTRWRAEGTLGYAGTLGVPVVEAAPAHRAGTPPRLKAQTVAASARTRWRWDGRTVRLEDARIAALGGTLTARAQLEPLARVPRYGAAGRLNGLSVAQLAALAGRPADFSGQVGGQFSLEGQGFQAPPSRGSAQLQAAVVAAPEALGNRQALPLQADARLQFAGRRIAIERVRLDTLGGRLQGSGEASVTDGRPDYRLAGTLAGLDLAALNRAFAFARGPVQGRLDATWRLDPRTLDVDRLAASVFGGQLTGDARVRLDTAPPRYEARLRSRGIDLAAAQRAFPSAAAPVSGRFDGELLVAGAGQDFRVAGPLAVTDIARVPQPELGAVRLVPFHAEARVAATPLGVSFAPLTMRVGGSRLELNGQLNRVGPSNLSLQGHVPDVEPLAALLGLSGLKGGPWDLSGRATGPAEALSLSAQLTAGPTRFRQQAGFQEAMLSLGGTLRERLQLSGQFRLSRLETQGRVVTRVEAPWRYEAPRARLAQGQLKTPTLLVQFPQGRIDGSALLALDRRRYQIQLASQALVLGDLTGPLSPDAADLPRQTPVHLRLSGQGDLSNPSLRLESQVSAFQYRGQSFASSRFSAALVDRQARWWGELFERQFVLTGQASTVAPHAGQMKLQMQDAQLAPLFGLVPNSARENVEWPLSGVMSGSIEAKGPLGAPRALQAALNLNRFELAYDDLRFANRGAVRARYEMERLTLQRLHLVGNGTDLIARGTVAPGQPSRFDLDGRVNLALLEKISPTQFADASGSAVIETQLRGTLGTPDLSGALTIRNGELRARALPQPLRELNGTVRLARDRVFLDSLRAMLGYTGRVQAYGGATLGPDFQPRRVNLQLNAQEVEVRQPGIQALVNADLGFSGTPDASRLDGVVRVVEGSYTQDIDLASGMKRKGKSGPSLDTLPFLRNLALQVQVLVPNQFIVKNNLAEGSVTGDVIVLGTLQRPVPVGRVAAPEGRVFFQDHTYTLEEASVDFLDPHQLTPYMHVLANTEISGYKVHVSANGTPDNLKLDLTSIPFLSQQDVLALIATGQTLSELGTGGVATAGNFLLNQIAGNVARGVTSRGVVDVLRVQPGTSPGSSIAGIGSLTVGKRVNDRLTITYSVDLAQPTGTSRGAVVTFDYLLTDDIVLKLDQGLNGGFNASARYRFNVR